MERVQKAAVAAIIGPTIESYEKALKTLNLERLSTRRDNICNKFVQKNMKSDKPFFKATKKVYNTRSNPNHVQEIRCRTQSLFTSSKPYLARLYNRKCPKNSFRQIISSNAMDNGNRKVKKNTFL